MGDFSATLDEGSSSPHRLIRKAGSKTMDTPAEKRNITNKIFSKSANRQERKQDNEDYLERTGRVDNPRLVAHVANRGKKVNENIEKFVTKLEGGQFDQQALKQATFEMVAERVAEKVKEIRATYK
jgi:hypothetical protein